jgi:hypothetical protein
MKPYFVFPLLLLLLYACSHTPEKQYPKLENMVEIKSDTGLFHFFASNASHKLTTILFKGRYQYVLPSGNNRFLLLAEVENPNSRDSIAIDSSLQFSSSGFVVGQNKTDLFFFDRRAKILYMLKIAGNKIVVAAKQNISGYDMKDRYNLSGKKFNIIKDENGYRLLFNYGNEKAAGSNYLDSSVFLLFSDKEQGLGQYKKEFYKPSMYYKSALNDVDSTGIIYYVHEMYDSIYALNTSGVTLYRNVLHQNPHFEKFDIGQAADAAYIRRFSDATEWNLKLKVIGNRYIVVLKRLYNDNILADPAYKYFVLNRQLQIVYADTIRQKVTPFLLEEYKNGFLVLGDSVKSGFYYEIK